MDETCNGTKCSCVLNAVGRGGFDVGRDVVRKRSKGNEKNEICVVNARVLVVMRDGNE